MSLSEREINLIHSKTTFVNGTKDFGEFDSLVTSTPISERFLGNQDLRSEATIIIPVMERAEKLGIFLNALRDSLDTAQIPVTLAVMDNSIERRMQTLISNADFGSSVTQIIYHHDPRMSQTSGRNFAYEKFGTESALVGVWDSDIYSSKGTVGNIVNTLQADPNLSGLAPPMAGYKGGNLDLVKQIYRNLTTNRAARMKLHMPGPIGEENGVWKGDILRTTMMRGSFMVKREMLEKIKLQNPDSKPWLEDFVLWQNVPFFISAREENFDFGYLMDQEAVVLHDDRVDELSVGYKLPYRNQETLKSLLMLMLRNEVFTDEGREINKNFLEYNLASIQRVTGLDENSSVRLQETMLRLAASFNKAETPSDWKMDIPEEFKDILDNLVQTLNYQPVFERVKSIKSSNPSRPMYTI
jgi:hypothetical protein